MLETKCVGDNFKMLVTVSANLVTVKYRLVKISSRRSRQKKRYKQGIYRSLEFDYSLTSISYGPYHGTYDFRLGNSELVSWYLG